MHDQVKKILIIQNPTLLNEHKNSTIDYLKSQISNHFPNACVTMQTQVSAFLPKDHAALLDHAHQWANQLYLVTNDSSQCFPIEGLVIPEITKRPIFLSAFEVMPGILIQDLTQYKHGLLSQWLKWGFAFEVLSVEVSIQVLPLPAKDTTKQLTEIFEKHPDQFVVISAQGDCIGAVATKELAEDLAKLHRERCNIYGPGRSHVGERWHDR